MAANHIELTDLNSFSPSATLVGTPSTFQNDNGYFDTPTQTGATTPVKDPNFDETTIKKPNGRRSLKDMKQFPYTVTYKGHDVNIDSIDFKKSTRLKFQVIMSFMFLIFTGLADQTSGTLLPSLVEYYEVDHSVISYIFIANFSGSLLAAMMNDHSHRLFGINGLLIISSTCWAICFINASFGPPLWLLIAGYFSYGFAGGAATGALNIWAGKLKYHNQIMGLMHACYGFGCMITPVAATHLLDRGMDWRHWYYVLIAVIAVLFVSTVFTFSTETRWKYLYLLEHGAKIHREQHGDKDCYDNDDDSSDDEFSFGDDEHEYDDDETVAETSTNAVPVSEVFKNKYIWFFSVTLFFYLGGESAIGNWVYNYLIIVKELTASESSYITSAYWLALTLGRVVIGLFIGKFFENEETTVAFAVCVLISIFTFLFTICSSLFLQAVSICAIGAFIGPVFPTTVIIALKTLPVNLHALGVGFISSCGSSGAALVPYIIGYVSAINNDKPGYVEGAGLVYFPVISLAVFGVAMVLWGGLFALERRTKRATARAAAIVASSADSVPNGINIAYERI